MIKRLLLTWRLHRELRFPIRYAWERAGRLLYGETLR